MLQRNLIESTSLDAVAAEPAALCRRSPRSWRCGGLNVVRYGARVLRPTRDEAKTARDTQAELCVAVAVHWRDESAGLSLPPT